MKTWIKHHRVELLILSLALVIRLAFSLVIHPAQNFIFSDMRSYLDISQRLLRPDGSAENIFYPIGYPLFLMLVGRITPNLLFPAVALLQSLMGLASIIMLYVISKNILVKKFRLLFLTILAFYYPWIDFGGYLMSETLATMLLVWMVYDAFFFFNHKNLLWLLFLPVVIGLSTLVRANMLLSGLFITFWLAAQVASSKSGLDHYQIIRRVFVFFCGSVLALLLSFQIYRFYGNTKSSMALNGGLNFMQGQCLFRGVSDSNGWSFGPPVFSQRNFRTEKHFDQPFTNSGYFYRQGTNCLIANPVQIIRKLTEPYYLFFDNTVWPSADQPGFGVAMKVSHTFFNVTILPGIFLAIYLFYKGGKSLLRSRLAILVLVVLSLVVTTIVYYADIRYRIPYDGFLILISLWSYQALKIKRNLKPIPE